MIAPSGLSLAHCRSGSMAAMRQRHHGEGVFIAPGGEKGREPKNSRGRTSQPLLRGEAGPVNDAKPVLLGRVGRRGAPLHGYCSSLLYVAAAVHIHFVGDAIKKNIPNRENQEKN